MRAHHPAEDKEQCVDIFGSQAGLQCGHAILRLILSNDCTLDEASFWLLAVWECTTLILLIRR